MKRIRIAALAALLALALALPCMAAAGDGSDPLISRSYADGAFRAEVSDALDAAAAAALAEIRAALPDGNGWSAYTLVAGDSVTLGDGQQLVLVSGALRLEIVSGRLVDVTQGRASDAGEARAGHRYVAWDGAEVRADCAGAAVVLCSSGAAARIAARDCPFTDVPAGAWYRTDVLSAWRRGLINGMTKDTYAPQGSLTLAQAVKLAACLCQLDREGAVTLTNAAAPRRWYDSYASYAAAHGILEVLPLWGWNEPIDRATFVKLLYRALPAARYAPINNIPMGAIPDVAAEDPGAAEIYAFYAAGILTGYTAGNGRAAHAFGAQTAISRAEVATILNRMLDAGARVRFGIAQS